MDVIHDSDTDNIYLSTVQEDRRKAKITADLVVVCPHMGGQFNIVPGSYAKFLMKFLFDCGADIVIGNHPHVIQKFEKRKNK